MRVRPGMRSPGIRAALSGALWLTGAASLASATCTREGSRCLCEDDTGTVWDLTALADDAEHQTDGPAASAGEWEYSFKFCDNIVPVDTPCANSQISETRAYRVSQGSTLQTCQQLGPAEGITSGMTPVSLQNGLSLRFLWLTRGLTVNLICDPTLRGQDTEPDRAVGTELATIEWTTFYVCAAHQNAGLSMGGLILILSSVATVLYLGGGVAYNRNKGHSGVENLVPQYEQWSQLPALVADGVWFTRVTLSQNIGACACVAPSGPGPSKSGGLYEEIDGGGACLSSAPERRACARACVRTDSLPPLTTTRRRACRQEVTEGEHSEKGEKGEEEQEGEKGEEEQGCSTAAAG
jgi:hypothetical protein